MNFSAPIIIEEYAGISRDREPVTVGIPIPEGALTGTDRLSLADPAGRQSVPLQATPLAHWRDGSIKWLLLDFQASVDGGQHRELSLQNIDGPADIPDTGLKINESENEIIVDTGSACFHVHTDVFRPFSNVVLAGHNFLTNNGSETTLEDASGNTLVPLITELEWETRGSLRSTLKITGSFVAGDQKNQLAFFSRLTFFAGISTSKVDFTVWNPKAAVHPGGLWDLGDPESFFFKDCSIHLFPQFGSQTQISWQEKSDAHVEKTDNSDLVIYQDSSGGENWQSRNHVNRSNEVKTSFRGYKILSATQELTSGLRAEPVIAVNDATHHITAAQKYFWQNFPKSLEADQQSVTLRFFPHQFADLYELQPGERKTHTCFLDFRKGAGLAELAGWVHNPIMVRSTPEWYAASKAISYLTAKSRSSEDLLSSLIQPAIEGDNSFFSRREIVDEYGWRNFGDWYADHEAVGYKGPPPLIAHYNNQYDGMYGSLRQFMQSGEPRWFLLGDQLCSHVRDIDIYHTDQDKPEFNKGLFWHTEHYLPAETATHRCFSQLHAPFRNLAQYGGGPAMSHNYSAGLLYHYYLTGDIESQAALLDLAECVQQNVYSRATCTFFLAEALRKGRSRLRNLLKGRGVVDFDKIFGFNGPGRSAGNVISTLMTAYELSQKQTYLETAEEVIRVCIHPDDDIENMDMLDIENRWMYTVFLQALSKYLDIAHNDANAQLWDYGRQCLLHYCRWMLENEYLYLDTPDKLEYPNETWAAQEIRKCNVFLYAAKYSEKEEQQRFYAKAGFFYQGCLKQLQSHETRNLTRPITLLLQNGDMMRWFEQEGESLFGSSMDTLPGSGSRLGRSKLFRRLRQVVKMFSFQSEKEFIRWRVKR